MLADYGAFRDLQRHRLLTLEWQPLSPEHGYTEPAAIEEAGALADWRAVMERSADLHATLLARGLPEVAPYAVVMALSRSLLYGYERARSPARHRVTHGTPGTPVHTGVSVS